MCIIVYFIGVPSERGKSCHLWQRELNMSDGRVERPGNAEKPPSRLRLEEWRESSARRARKLEPPARIWNEDRLPRLKLKPLRKQLSDRGQTHGQDAARHPLGLGEGERAPGFSLAPIPPYPSLALFKSANELMQCSCQGCKIQERGWSEIDPRGKRQRAASIV